MAFGDAMNLQYLLYIIYRYCTYSTKHTVCYAEFMCCVYCIQYNAFCTYSTYNVHVYMKYYYYGCAARAASKNDNKISIIKLYFL